MTATIRVTPAIQVRLSRRTRKENVEAMLPVHKSAGVVQSHHCCCRCMHCIHTAACAKHSCVSALAAPRFVFTRLCCADDDNDGVLDPDASPALLRRLAVATHPRALNMAVNDNCPKGEQRAAPQLESRHDCVGDAQFVRTPSLSL
jgi:hypothetical protein